MLGYALILVLLYLLLVRLMASSLWRARFGALAVVLTLSVSTVYLFVTLLNWIEWWGLVGRIAMPPLRPAYGSLAYGSPNIVAALLLAIGPVACAVLGWSGGARRGVAVGLVLLVIVCVAFTGSRGAWLGAGVGGSVTAIAWGSLKANRRRLIAAIQNIVPRARVAFALLSISTGVVAFLALRSRLTVADHGLRATYLDVSAAMFRSSPLTGLGPGTWPVQRASFTPDTGIDFWNPHAQSIYLQSLAEFGLVGVIAGMVLLCSLAWLVREALRSEDPVRLRVGYATLFVLTAMAVQQTVDFFANIPALLVAVALPVAWLDATASEPRWSRVVCRVRWPARPFAILAAIAVVLVTVGLLRIETIAATSARGVALARAGDWNAALASFSAAADEDPDVPLYWYRLGIAAANVQQHNTARLALERSATHDGSAVAWICLAAEDLAVGDLANAEKHVSRGERLGWQDATAMVSAAAIRYKLGQQELAVRDAGYALQDAPSLAADRAGWSLILPDVPIEDIIDAAVEQLDRRRATYGATVADSTQGAIAVFASRAELAIGASARLRADGIPADLAEVPTVAEKAWSGDQKAVRALERIARDRPTRNAVISWLALLADRAGNSAESAEYRRQALINNAFAVAGVWRLTITAWTPDAFLHAGPTGQYASAYRRQPLDIATTRALPALARQ